MGGATMSAKKQVVVRIDGKDRKSNSIKKIHSGVDKIERTASEEVAAAEESGANKLHTFSRDYDTTFMLSKTPTKKQSNFAMFKPIIIAIISAITIGSIMGFVMLKIIVNFDNDLNASPAFLVPTDENNNGQGEEKTENPPTNSTTLHTIDSMSAFVLQGGVFSTVENAEAESVKFVEQGYAPIIWEKEGQFYLLVNLGMSKEDLQDDTNALMNSGIEVYAKEWQVSEMEMELTKEEYDWLLAFQDQWNISLGTGMVEAREWQALMDQAPEQSEILASFIPSIGEYITAEKDSDGILLAIWQEYNFLLHVNQMNLD